MVCFEVVADFSPLFELIMEVEAVSADKIIIGHAKLERKMEKLKIYMCPIVQISSSVHKHV